MVVIVLGATVAGKSGDLCANEGGKQPMCTPETLKLKMSSMCLNTVCWSLEIFQARCPANSPQHSKI